MTDWTTAHGAITAYPDIPSEYLVGLDRGKLGAMLQEVHDAGWDIHVLPGHVVISEEWEYTGTDDDTHRVDIMIARAYLAWKGRN